MVRYAAGRGARAAPALRRYGLLVLGLVVLSLLGWNRLLSRRVDARTAALNLARQESFDVRDRLVATLEAIPDLLFELDASGCYLDVYATRDALLAAPREALIGHNVAEVLCRRRPPGPLSRRWPRPWAAGAITGA